MLRAFAPAQLFGEDPYPNVHILVFDLHFLVVESRYQEEKPVKYEKVFLFSSMCCALGGPTIAFPILENRALALPFFGKLWAGGSRTRSAEGLKEAVVEAGKRNLKKSRS